MRGWSHVKCLTPPPKTSSEEQNHKEMVKIELSRLLCVTVTTICHKHFIKTS